MEADSGAAVTMVTLSQQGPGVQLGSELGVPGYSSFHLQSQTTHYFDELNWPKAWMWWILAVLSDLLLIFGIYHLL